MAKKKATKEKSQQVQETAPKNVKNIDDYEQTYPLQLALFEFVQPDEKKFPTPLNSMILCRNITGEKPSGSTEISRIFGKGIRVSRFEV